jgi:hypothetical protein
MRKIAENLIRQHKGLQLLSELLQQEYAELKGKDQQDLAVLEFSIQELIRQLAAEKEHLQRLLEDGQPQVQDLQGLAKSLSGKQGLFVQDVRGKISTLEQRCREQARANADLSLALLEQSRELMGFLQDQLKQGSQDLYSQKGSWKESSIQEPSILKGRL